jgi:RNA 2',3'-cyclic 3'-phosphodiesterase
MQRRIFIGISVPKEVKKRLVQKTEKWQEFPVVWTKPEKFHITLSFLGFIDDSALAEACDRVKEVAENFEAFDFDLNKIELGPDKGDPKMAWAVGDPSEELKKLQEEIEKALDIFKAEKKEFRPHLALGRIRKKKWDELAEKPKIEEKINYLIPVESVEIFETKLDRAEGEYFIFESCPLK